jgi:pyruvate ferredoxin oxidoreductase alpha subunit
LTVRFITRERFKPVNQIITMPKKTLMDGNAAAAWGARLSKVQVVPNFPVTPQTEIIETLAEWSSSGAWKGRFLPVESEHSVLSAAVASSATGARTFTGSSSQGLLLMHEVMYIASGMRLPIVMMNVSRALSAPITLWPDHNDFLDQRDAGWLMFACERNQEVLDTVIQAFKVSESTRVMLPSLVNLDGFILSYTREPTEIPDQKKVDSFLPKFKPKVSLDPKKPMALGIGVMKEYSYFRNQAHLAQKNALKVIKEVQDLFGRKFGRRYRIVEPYMMEGAKAALVTMGANTTIARAAVKSLRAKGKKIGLVRLRLVRPFPEEDLKKALSKVEAIGVVDQNLAPGKGGILYPEVRSTMYESRLPISNFIISLGGKHISREEFETIGEKILETTKTKKPRMMWQGKFL